MNHPKCKMFVRNGAHDVIQHIIEGLRNKCSVKGCENRESRRLKTTEPQITCHRQGKQSLGRTVVAEPVQTGLYNVFAETTDTDGL
ncbi:hypothetical protein NECAME_06705 [Necator americanus]|uniref:Uncharacterized protein n=1 Tax=Necator americanus TaxID=51031 RepID=W2TUH6_NECAM|nr:hypothetical protein NECAME_06705 [Necator americanus]ETN84741.1 hypothetical protein NECAME_06705 [Necator americanus]